MGSLMERRPPRPKKEQAAEKPVTPVAEKPSIQQPEPGPSPDALELEHTLTTLQAMVDDLVAASETIRQAAAAQRTQAKVDVTAIRDMIHTEMQQSLHSLKTMMHDVVRDVIREEITQQLQTIRAEVGAMSVALERSTAQGQEIWPSEDPEEEDVCEDSYTEDQEDEEEGNDAPFTSEEEDEGEEEPAAQPVQLVQRYRPRVVQPIKKREPDVIEIGPNTSHQVWLEPRRKGGR